MGTLDEAIREHLELKRRSGAGDDEVSRLENEAFGAARREPPAPANTTPDDPEVAVDVPAVAADVPPPPPAAPARQAPAPATPAADTPPPAPAAGDSWLEDDIAEPELPAVPREPDTREHAPPAPGAPSSDYVAPDEEGEDLLEETPDFLQETPEHDRLWFEQKPPRDFDFE